MFQIKDYLKPSFVEEEIVPDNPYAAKKPKPTARRKPEPNIKVQVSGADFLITRKTAQKETTLACIISQDLLFIRNEKTKEDTPATPDLIRSFMGTTNQIDVIDSETDEECSWLGYLEKGKAAAESFYEFWQVGTVKALAKKGLLFVDTLTGRRCSLYQRNSIKDHNLAERYVTAMFKKVPDSDKKSAKASLGNVVLPIYGSYGWSRGNDRCFDRKYDAVFRMFYQQPAMTFFEMADGWGISGTTDFFAEYAKAPMALFCEADALLDVTCKNYKKYADDIDFSVTSIRPFKRPALQDYLIYGALDEGDTDGNHQFVGTYSDYLRMRDELSAVSPRQYPLYPDHLYSAEHRLASEHRAYMRELAAINDEEWAEYVKFMSQYEYQSHDGLFEIIAPKEKSDMLDEAVQQKNCLSSYIKRVRDGECMIFFCRKSATPNRSYVTVEVLPDGSLGQVLAACNREPDAMAMSFVRKWHEKFFRKGEEATA